MPCTHTHTHAYVRIKKPKLDLARHSLVKHYKYMGVVVLLLHMMCVCVCMWLWVYTLDLCKLILTATSSSSLSTDSWVCFSVWWCCRNCLWDDDGLMDIRVFTSRPADILVSLCLRVWYACAKIRRQWGVPLVPFTNTHTHIYIYLSQHMHTHPVTNHGPRICVCVYLRLWPKCVFTSRVFTMQNWCVWLCVCITPIAYALPVIPVYAKESIVYPARFIAARYAARISIQAHRVWNEMLYREYQVVASDEYYPHIGVCLLACLLARRSIRIFKCSLNLYYVTFNHRNSPPPTQPQPSFSHSNGLRWCICTQRTPIHLSIQNYVGIFRHPKTGWVAPIRLCVRDIRHWISQFYVVMCAWCEFGKPNDGDTLLGQWWNWWYYCMWPKNNNQLLYLFKDEIQFKFDTVWQKSHTGVCKNIIHIVKPKSIYKEHY